MGVGGDDSWTASVHEGTITNTICTIIFINATNITTEFLLQPEVYDFGFHLEVQKENMI